MRFDIYRRVWNFCKNAHVLLFLSRIKNYIYTSLCADYEFNRAQDMYIYTKSGKILGNRYSPAVHVFVYIRTICEKARLIWHATSFIIITSLRGWTPINIAVYIPIMHDVSLFLLPTLDAQYLYLLTVTRLLYSVYHDLIDFWLSKLTQLLRIDRTWIYILSRCLGTF